MAEKSTVAAIECANAVPKLLSTCVCIALAVGSASTTSAAVLTVTSNADLGPGSLRDTVFLSHLGDTINFQAGLTSPITLTTGQISIQNTLTINGPGAGLLTISANNASRIFYESSTSLQTVTISGLTLSDGYVTGFRAYGGAVETFGPNLVVQDCVISNSKASLKGGGIYARTSGGALTLSGVTLQGNTANVGGGAYLYSSGNLLVENSLVTGNAANGGGGLQFNGGSAASVATVTGTRVLNNQGGGIESGGGTLTISDSEISGNETASSGGGVNPFGVFTMTRSVVSGNTAGNNGGGIYLVNAYAGSKIAYSTISNNTSSTNGGGLSVQFINGAAGYTTTLVNSTVAGNTATGKGGGIYSSAGPLRGTMPLKIESSTIADNRAATGGGVVALSSVGTQGFLHNTIVANNAATTADPDTSGTFTANFNFVYAPGSATLTGSNNTTGVNPQLGSLGNYGGTTPSKLPGIGSPVIDAGDTAATTLTSDQRGLARVVGGRIDIGADERQTTEDTIFLDGLEGY